MDALHYRDFDLDIDPAAGRRYPVRVLSLPAGQARGLLALPFDVGKLKERLAALEEAIAYQRSREIAAQRAMGGIASENAPTTGRITAILAEFDSQTIKTCARKP